MSDRPIGLGKVAENGTLNENGAFYSVQDINVLLEEKGGSGGDLPTPTVADAGKAVVVDEEGKYALGEAGGGSFKVNVLEGDVEGQYYLDKNYNEINEAFENGSIILTITESNNISRIGYLDAIGISQDEYAVNFGDHTFISDSATGVLTESLM